MTDTQSCNCTCTERCSCILDSGCKCNCCSETSFGITSTHCKDGIENSHDPKESSQRHSTIEFLDHPADVMMHCTSSSIQSLYEAAVCGMMQYAFKAPSTPVSATHGKVTVNSQAHEIMVADLLSHFIDILYAEGLAVVSACVCICSAGLVCNYTAIDSSECEPLCEIKAITLCGLKVYEQDGIFHMYCIFDV